MKEFKSIDDILDFAINNEQNAVDFYTQLASESTNEEMIKVFTQFAKEEIDPLFQLIIVFGNIECQNKITSRSFRLCGLSGNRIFEPNLFPGDVEAVYFMRFSPLVQEKIIFGEIVHHPPIMKHPDRHLKIGDIHGDHFIGLIVRRSKLEQA